MFLRKLKSLGLGDSDSDENDTLAMLGKPLSHKKK